VPSDGAGASPNPVAGETQFATLDTPGNSLLELYLGGISAQGFGPVLDHRKFQPQQAAPPAPPAGPVASEPCAPATVDW
jgi:hypothetical protein